MAEETILESTERTSGRDALRKNVQAAIALSGAVRSTLGPKGLDKLLVDDAGGTLVTNDGVTVLETARVEHPVAKMIISASSTQDKVAKDGTTSTVVICAEMLRNAWQLVGQGVHPATISRGYAQAEQLALGYLDELSITANKDQVLSAVETSLSGKLDRAMEKHLAKLSVAAGEIIFSEGRADSTTVKIIKQTGGNMTESKVIKGLALAKTRIHPEMKERGGPGKILLIDGGLEKRQPKLDAKFNITSAGMMEAFRKAESKEVLEQVRNIVEIGCDLLVCKEGVDDEARQLLANEGILTYRRVERKDLDLLARSCNANLVIDAKKATAEDLGEFESTREELSGGVNHWILNAEIGGATLIAKGSTSDIVNEVERCFEDGLGVACQLLENPVLLPGAGATQSAIARRLRRDAEGVPGREQIAIEAWADALESIPRFLASNSGFDGVDSILKLTSAQNQEGDTYGLNLTTGEAECSVKRGVLEPLTITKQSISGATEAAISVLRIDDILWAQMEAEIPDDVQQQIQGFGAE